MVLTHDNIFSMCDSVKLAYDNGAKQFSFTFVIDNDDYQDKNIPYLERHDPLKLIDAFISQMSKLNEITQEWWIEYSFPMCVYSEKQLEVLRGKIASPCQIHKRNSVTFDTEMNLLPCDMYFNNKIGRLGKDFNNLEDFLKLRERNKYKDIIDNINQMPSEKCIQCQYLEKCYGGCPVFWKNYSFEELERYKRKMLSQSK